MNDRADLETWADALLDQHRTAPRSAPQEPVRVEDLPPMMRLSVRLGGDMPDAETLERMRRLGERRARLEHLQAVVSLIGILGLAAFAYSLLSTF